MTQTHEQSQDQELGPTRDLHLLHRLVGVVGDVDVDADRLPVIINLRRHMKTPAVLIEHGANT